MARGKLYEVVNEGQLKWSFFSDDMTYLAGFSQREAAETYGGMYGYETSDPQQVNASVFDAKAPAPAEVRGIRSNSPVPNLQLGKSARSEETPATASPSPAGQRLFGRRR